MSRQSAFLFQKNSVLNRDLSELSSELAFPSLSTVSRAKSGDRKKSSASKGKSMSKPRDPYETPKFEKFKSAESGLNRDLHTVQKRSMRSSLPPKTKAEKKYGINVTKKVEKF